MKKNMEAVLGVRIEADLNSQYNELFQNPHNATDISVKDKEWFKEVFLEGETRAMDYLREITGRNSELGTFE